MAAADVADSAAVVAADAAAAVVAVAAAAAVVVVVAVPAGRSFALFRAQRIDHGSSPARVSTQPGISQVDAPNARSRVASVATFDWGNAQVNPKSRFARLLEYGVAPRCEWVYFS